MIRSSFVGLLVLLSLSAMAEGVKVSERFGYDPVDATANLQAALDSGLSEIVVDKKGGPWVTRPLFARSNQTVVFEKGVELVAKKGAFRNCEDCLFTISCATNVTIAGYGATWRMRRADYDAAPYKKGEWRHALSIVSGDRITVEGLAIVESGGDGVYVGRNRRRKGGPSTDVILRDLVCDRHYRQGISVITARRLLIERCVLVNTWGTPPAAGIDFEPNRAEEELVGCVMRDCRIANNQGSGIEFYLGQLRASSVPLSVRIENCVSSDNVAGFRLLQRDGGDLPKGTISVTGCRFEREYGPAVFLQNSPKGAVAAEFENCIFDSCQTRASDPVKSCDIEISDRSDLLQPATDGYAFRDCTIRQTVARDFISRRGKLCADAVPKAVSGKVRVIDPKETREIALDDTWAEGYFPHHDRPLPPPCAFDPSRAEPTDLKPGQAVRVAPFRFRSSANFLLHAASSGAIRLTGKTVRLGMRTLGKLPSLKVTDLEGGVVATLPAFGTESTEVVFDVPSPGFYRFEVDVGRYAFELLATTVPIALDTFERQQGILSPVGSLFFRPKAGDAPALAIRGSGGVEFVKATIRDVAGKPVWSREALSEWEVALLDGGEGFGLWRLDLGRPSKGVFDDCSLRLLGIPAQLFLSSEKYW